MITDSEIVELENLVHLEEIAAAKDNLLDFTIKTMPSFECAPFHRQYYKILDLFAKGKIKKLMITMPPQHGKSQGSTRQLPAYIFGLDRDRKIAIASYSSTFARKFNRDIQKIIDNEVYAEVFPETKLQGQGASKTETAHLRNTDEFEIVGNKGSLKAVGRGGALTGNTVDTLIIDDLYKDYEEGNSPIIRESAWDWYTSTADTRLHNNSQQLIVFTRWNEEDLIGKLGEKETIVEISSIDEIEGIDENSWVKVNFEALMTKEATAIDNRPLGDPLWPSRHSKEKLERSKNLDEEKFDCLHQGDPQSKAGLLYRVFGTYDSLPQLRVIKNYTDTADMGSDYLCSMSYGEPVDPADEHLYVVDLLYTQDAMEVTEPSTIALINRSGVNDVMVESNNGGRSFARVIEQGVTANVEWFFQSSNKEARIFSQSAQVNRTIIFPSDWHLRWPVFYDHVRKYKKIFKSNKHDDAPDTMTGIIEQRGNEPQILKW